MTSEKSAVYSRLRNNTYFKIFSAIFDTEQSKDDVIDVMVTSLTILLLLILRDVVLEYQHAVFSGNWTKIKEKRKGEQSAPSLYINKIPQPE